MWNSSAQCSVCYFSALDCLLHLFIWALFRVGIIDYGAYFIPTHHYHQFCFQWMSLNAVFLGSEKKKYNTMHCLDQMGWMEHLMSSSITPFQFKIGLFCVLRLCFYLNLGFKGTVLSKIMENQVQNFLFDHCFAASVNLFKQFKGGLKMKHQHLVPAFTIGLIICFIAIEYTV